MFEVTDYHELLALNKSLFEARYHADPMHREIPGSPFVAAMHERVLAAIFAHDNTPQPKIDHFLKWANRKVEQDAVRRQLADDDWCRMDSKTKREYVQLLVRPFVASQTEIDSLIQFAENEHDQKQCPRCDGH